jgi:primosomal protein N' (replication factor Y)
MAVSSPQGTECAETVADVAVAGARRDRSPDLSYAVPPALRGRLRPGQVVWAPLRGKPALGIVTRLHDEPRDFALKPLSALVESPVAISADQFVIARWLARETVCTLYEALALFLPPGMTHRAQPYLRLTAASDGRDRLTAGQRRLVDLLAERGETSLAAARKALGTSLTTVVPALEEAGFIERVYRLSDRAPAPRQERWVRLVAETGRAAPALPTSQAAIVETLRQRRRLAFDGADGFVRASDVLAQSGSARAALTALTRKGIVEEISRQAGAPLAGERRALGPVPELTPAQARAWAAIERALERRDSTPHLLYGVTGSGKTELYLRAAAWCLRHGRSAIILVPEIALSSQVADRFAARFGEEVAVLHSGLSDAARHAAWQEIAQGRHPIVIGPRSALFAPAPDIGLIVLDEEHDPAYKQDTAPRYHARAVAEAMAHRCGAAVVVGSATPAVETFWRAQQGELRLLPLPERVGPALIGALGTREGSALELPPVDVVDMRLELHRGNASLLSQPLQELLAGTLRRREQAILLLNRRGLATVVLCRACGTTLLCPYCDIPLVYHQDRDRLVCHRCDHREMPRRACPACGGALNYFGAGTQRVEAEARRLFPEARVLRWDQDVVRHGGGSERLLQQVERGEADIVVGTQMVAKGFDLPRVTGIGVVNADTSLHLPDFRSGERTFSLLTQVAGRAGRRGPGSRVVVQSYTPEHYAIQAASRHDYETFFAEEIDFAASTSTRRSCGWRATCSATAATPPAPRRRTPWRASWPVMPESVARRWISSVRRPRSSRGCAATTSGTSSSAHPTWSRCWTVCRSIRAGASTAIPRPCSNGRGMIRAWSAPSSPCLAPKEGPASAGYATEEFVAASVPGRSPLFRGLAVVVLTLSLAACGNQPDTGTQITPPVPNSPTAGEMPDKTFEATAKIVNGKLDPPQFAGQVGTAFRLAVTGDGKEHTLAIAELVDGKTIAPSGVTNVTFTIEGQPGELEITLDGNPAGTFQRQSVGGGAD